VEGAGSVKGAGFVTALLRDSGLGLGSRLPPGGVRPFHQKSTCITQSILGPYVVHIWSRNFLKFRGNEPLELHRVEAWAWSPGSSGSRSSIQVSGFRVDGSGFRVAGLGFRV